MIHGLLERRLSRVVFDVHVGTAVSIEQDVDDVDVARFDAQV